MIGPSNRHPLPWRESQLVVAGARPKTTQLFRVVVAANGVEVLRTEEPKTATFIVMMANEARNIVWEIDSSYARDGHGR